MTSGQCATAAAGAVGEIARYIAHAAGRIEILPAAGIRPENVEALICDGLHGVYASLREPIGLAAEIVTDLCPSRPTWLRSGRGESAPMPPAAGWCGRCWKDSGEQGVPSLTSYSHNGRHR